MPGQGLDGVLGALQARVQLDDFLLHPVDALLPTADLRTGPAGMLGGLH